MLMEGEFWVSVAFLHLRRAAWLCGRHKTILRGLDGQRDRIKSELDEARRLREDAASLLADYHRKQREAETEAQAIIAGAQAEVERITTERHMV